MTQALKCHESYSMGEKYNYRAEMQYSIVENLPSAVRCRCPAKKIVRIVVDLLKVNPFECALLCWLLKKTKFEAALGGIDLAQHSVNFSMVEEAEEKKMLILLLLNGYNVKSHLLVSGAQIDIDSYVFENIPHFDQIYKNWKPEKSLKNISLAEINKIFESWTSRKRPVKKVDYNQMVDNILYLSKTYNVGSAEDANTNHGAKVDDQKANPQFKEKRAGRKRIKKQEQKSDRTFERLSASKNRNSSPMKQSVSNRFPWMEDWKPENDLNPLRRSTRNMNRSFFEIKDSGDLMNPGQSLFKSYRSKHSNNNVSFNNGQQDVNMFQTIRNTSNGLNLGSLHFNNSLAGNNMFNSSIGLGLRNSGTEEKIYPDLVQAPKLKATDSFEEEQPKS